MIWLASMLFFGRIPPGLTHIPSQLITAAGVACFGGDRRAAIVTERVSAKPLRPTCAAQGHRFSNLPVLVCPQPLRGASSQHTRRFIPFQHLPLFRPPLNWLRLLRQLGFQPPAPPLRGFFAPPPSAPLPALRVSLAAGGFGGSSRRGGQAFAAGGFGGASPFASGLTASSQAAAKAFAQWAGGGKC